MCWKLWLARNERVFKNESRSQHSLIYATVQAATKFYYLAGTLRQTQARFLQFIRWHASPNPYVTLNTNGSALSNLGVVGAGGMLRDHLGYWIAGFSLHLSIATNNIAELEAVRQGLEMAWQLGFKFIQLEIDSNVVRTWLTDTTVCYLTHMMPLICDRRSLMDRDWVVQVHHIYREANACADTLAKRGRSESTRLNSSHI